jgi:hypothetical protein
MRTRDRDPREQEPAREPLVPEPGAGAEAAAARARSLLDLGDEVIRRALSGDSERFLAQNRQQGGQ